MADQDQVTPSREIFLEGDIAYTRAVSESLLQKFAAASNYIMDRIYIQEQFAFNGYFEPNSFDDGVSGIRYVERISNISSYYMSIRDTGSGTANSFNIALFNNSGGSIGNLFSTPISISGSNGTNLVAGKRDIQDTPVDFQVNQGVHTIDFGTLALTQLPAGTVMVPFIAGNASGARNLFFNLRLEEV